MVGGVVGAGTEGVPERHSIDLPAEVYSDNCWSLTVLVALRYKLAGQDEVGNTSMDNIQKFQGIK